MYQLWNLKFPKYPQGFFFYHESKMKYIKVLLQQSFLTKYLSLLPIIECYSFCVLLLITLHLILRNHWLLGVYQIIRRSMAMHKYPVGLHQWYRYHSLTLEIKYFRLIYHLFPDPWLEYPMLWWCLAAFVFLSLSCSLSRPRALCDCRWFDTCVQLRLPRITWSSTFKFLWAEVVSDLHTFGLGLNIFWVVPEIATCTVDYFGGLPVKELSDFLSAFIYAFHEHCC